LFSEHAQNFQACSAASVVEQNDVDVVKFHNSMILMSILDFFSAPKQPRPHLTKKTNNTAGLFK
jgi:hypothetical protein